MPVSLAPTGMAVISTPKPGAPAAGRVLTADVPIGSVVMPGQTLARITAGPMVVRIELPEGQARALKVGDVVQLAAEDLRGVAAQGAITQVYPSVTGGQVMLR